MSTKCVYCGNNSFGACGLAPKNNGQMGNHKHSSDGQRCVYCGNTGFGACGLAPKNNGQMGNHER